MDNCKCPANCEILCVPRVNSTLWNELPKKAHQIDLELQETHKAIVKTAQVLFLITEDKQGAFNAFELRRPFNRLL